jgi:single-strand DNA-binding protein
LPERCGTFLPNTRHFSKKTPKLTPHYPPFPPRSGAKDLHIPKETPYFVGKIKIKKRKSHMSINKVILVGNVGRDPEVRYYEPGKAVASFPLATSERGYTLPNGTQVPERTDWHNIVLWRGLAETAEKYVHKGDKLYIEGKIRTRSYSDQNGVQRYVTEVYAEAMELLSARPAQNAAPAQGNAAQNTGKAEEPLPF